MPAALWKSAGSIVGYLLGSIGQESEQTETYAPSTDLQEMVLKKTQKCLSSTQSKELRIVLAEQWNFQETG